MPPAGCRQSCGFTRGSGHLAAQRGNPVHRRAKSPRSVNQHGLDRRFGNRHAHKVRTEMLLGACGVTPVTDKGCLSSSGLNDPEQAFGEPFCYRTR